MVVMGVMGGGWKMDLHWCLVVFVVGGRGGAVVNGVNTRNWRSFK